MTQIFFTSDSHFGHKNIIKYCVRPFETLEEMDATMIENWNKTVRPEDTIIHLGDFSFASRERTEEITRLLNGYKTLVMGNHDKLRPQQYRDMGWGIVHPYKEPIPALMPMNGTMVLLKHVPIPYTLPEGIKHQICGHVHEAWKVHKDRYSTVVNVGVDQWRFTPVHLEEVIKELGIG